jgi:hypothetical protein
MILSEAVDVKFGDDSVDKIYAGTNLIWQADGGIVNYTLNNTSDGYIASGVIGGNIVGSVNIPLTYNGLPVVEIGDECFRDQEFLTGATIGGNVVTIGTKAFQDCIALTSISHPDSVTTIKGYAYDGCYFLTSLNIGNNVTTIFAFAFNGCSRLASINIPDSVTVIARSAFTNCQLANPITIGSGLTSISSSLFFNCRAVTELTLPSAITYIGFTPFYFNVSLTTLNCLATTAPSIETSSFNGVATSTINVPVGATGYGTTFGGLTVNYSL